MSPPPPASVTRPAQSSGVPPTPAPATPGLPSSPASASTPSTTGLPNQTLSELRPGQPVDASQVQAVQTQLSTDGFYHGPIDGLLSGPTRAAIRAFQEAAQLPATGQLDAQTAATMGLPQSAAVTTPATSPTSAAGPGGVSPLAPPSPSALNGRGVSPGVLNRASASSVPFPLENAPPVSSGFPTPPIFIQP